MRHPFVWIVEGVLAQSPLPSPGALDELARVFTGVVSLAEKWEMWPGYLDALRARGVEVLHVPTPEGHPVELLGLLRAAELIERHRKMGGAVLVHCRGGAGRSGQVTAAYLVYGSSSPREALEAVRELVPGSASNFAQERAVIDFHLLLAGVGRNRAPAVAEALSWLAEAERRAYSHLSKVVQLTIELYDGIWGPGPGLANEIRAALNHVHGDVLARLWRTRAGIEHGDGRLARVAHVMDYSMDSRVVTLVARKIDRAEIGLLCSAPCDDVAEELERDKSLLVEALGEEPVLWWGSYVDYL
ncbi:MAG: dual specificity protein phosphatase family protein [Desulfurococcaceae archaeon]